MKQFYTYIYRDPSKNNEPIYVGKGHGRRAYKHLSRKDIHPFVQRLQLMKKNGITPDIEIINCCDEEFALLLEEEMIDKYGRRDLGKGTLLNLTDGGEGPSGYTYTDEAKQKMSQKRKGKKRKPHTDETKLKISQSQKGKKRNPCTNETKAKISQSNKGKSFSDEHKKKLSDAKKGKPAHNKSKPRSEETKLKISQALKGKNTRPKSAETKKKMSEAWKERRAKTKKSHELTIEVNK